MPWTHGGAPQPKPASRKKVKAKATRVERQVIKSVRERCVERDGYCRLAGMTERLICHGPSEWAHLNESRRFKTRGMAPEDRHTTAGSFMACESHHAAYDAHAVDIIEQTDRGADGPLTVELRDA